jgi:hypothetical protein
MLRLCVIAAMTLGPASASALAGPRLIKSITSNEQVGVAVTGKAKGRRGVAATLGMWSDDGALELGGFDDRSARLDPVTARTAAIVSGRAMQSRGVRLTGSLYRTGPAGARGLTVSVDARRQQVSDVGAALSGTWRTLGESRLTVGGRLKF